MTVLRFNAGRGVDIEGASGAWLADVDTSDVIGGELVIDYDFSAGGSGWLSSAGVTYASNTAEITTTGAGAQAIDQLIPTVIGDMYYFAVDIAGLSPVVAAGLYLRISSSYRGGYNLLNLGAKGGAYGMGGVFVFKFIATSSGAWLRVMNAYNSNCTLTVNSVSVFKIIADATGGDNGLLVHGTVPRSAVAEGAELVAWGPFSAVNYLEHPYSPDLNYGVGDFYYSAWVSNLSAGNYILDRGDVAGGANVNRVAFLVDGAGLLFFYTTDAAGGASSIAGGDVTGADSLHVFCVRRAGVLELWIDGVLSVSSSRTIRDVTSTSNRLRIGVRYALAAQGQGRVTLVHTGAYAPTTEQIKKWYDEQKHLFKPSSALTIKGGEYSIDIGTTVLNASPDTSRAINRPVGNAPAEVVIRRQTRKLNLTTQALPPSDMRRSMLYELLYAAERGAIVTVDEAGTVESPVELITYQMLRDYREQRHRKSSWKRITLPLTEVSI